MVDINPLTTSGIVISGVSDPKAAGSLVKDAKADAKPTRALDAAEREQRPGAGREALEISAKEVETVVNKIAQDISISFRVEEELSRMVVAVRAVGSDEIIRQFPPEEFITVAKHIAAQNPDVMDGDYLKGILFDQRT